MSQAIMTVGTLRAQPLCRMRSRSPEQCESAGARPTPRPRVPRRGLQKVGRSLAVYSWLRSSIFDLDMDRCARETLAVGYSGFDRAGSHTEIGGAIQQSRTFLLGVQEVPGSNPGSPTTIPHRLTARNAISAWPVESIWSPKVDSGLFASRTASFLWHPLSL
jgi:hypothetical protein